MCTFKALVRAHHDCRFDKSVPAYSAHLDITAFKNSFSAVCCLPYCCNQFGRYHVCKFHCILVRKPATQICKKDSQYQGCYRVPIAKPSCRKLYDCESNSCRSKV